MHANQIAPWLASVALIVASLLGGMVQDAYKLVAAPMTATPVEQGSTQAAPTSATPANEPSAESDSAPPDAVTVSEPAAVRDPLALLDPADRVIAERIRDLLATKPERFFAGKIERAAAEAFYQH